MRACSCHILIRKLFCCMLQSMRETVHPLSRVRMQVEDRTYVQDKREDLVKEGLQLIKEKLTNEQNHRGLSYDRILKKIDLDISQTSANIRSQTMMRESSESSLIHVMENLAIQVKEELKAEKLERKKTDVGLIRVLEDTFTTYN